MKIVETFIKGLFIIEPKIFEDSRGEFFETYSEKILAPKGINVRFVQDNQSVSHKNVLRGLHFQNAPYAQGKLVRVARGKALDVVVDIRPESETFGKHFSLLLDAEQKKMMWIPPGFAHGFVALEDETIFLYKVTEYYNAASESGIIYNDADLGIDWQTSKPLVSEKDLLLPSFASLSNRLHSATAVKEK